MIYFFKYNLFLIYLNIFNVYSWGYIGHQLVGSIAENYLTQNSLKHIELLNNGKNLSSIANWADIIRNDPTQKYTEVFHYAETHDNIPSFCDFHYENDCLNNKCIVGAIYNYTHQLKHNTQHNLNLTEKNKALKFIVHFLGDIHQPLHVSGRARGGNDVNAIFLNKTINLHKVWDYLIIMKRLNDNFNNDYYLYLQHLILSNKENLYCDSNPINPKKWASESNQYNCDIVWPSFLINNGVLNIDYYKTGLHLIENQLIKAGNRLACVLNYLLDEHIV